MEAKRSSSSPFQDVMPVVSVSPSLFDSRGGNDPGGPWSISRIISFSQSLAIGSIF